MAVKDFREREHQRYFVHKHVNYVYDRDYGYADNTVFRGITIDSSPTGMCIYVYYPLIVGDHLNISQDMYSVPKQSAMACWIQKINSDVFKVGLKFDPGE